MFLFGLMMIAIGVVGLIEGRLRPAAGVVLAVGVLLTVIDLARSYRSAPEN